MALCLLGSGSSADGLLHGVSRRPKSGRQALTTLGIPRATGYPNDLPVKNYDFNAPIGEYGQLNPQYYWLRRLHWFLRDFGGGLAPMPLTRFAGGQEDLATQRWSVRSDGRSGFIFENNYHRLHVPAKTDVQFGASAGR